MITAPDALPAGAQQALILLERLVAEARAGRVPAIAVVVPRGGQVEVQIAGTATMSDFYFGGGLLQQRVMAMAAPPPGAPSSLLRVGALPR